MENVSLFDVFGVGSEADPASEVEGDVDTETGTALLVKLILVGLLLAISGFHDFVLDPRV